MSSCTSTNKVPVSGPAVPVREDPVINETAKKKYIEDEYARSIGTTAVTKDTFADDKTAVLGIISQLDEIMKDLDFKGWKTFIEPDSLEYWQRPDNLKRAQNRLPIKGIQLRSLEDYFKFVFIPSRAGRNVTEIRYISDTAVKAVSVQQEQDIIYYYFKKVNGVWMLQLPPIDN
jgi:hypothetical protein